MAFQPEDPDHKNNVVELLQELLDQQKITNNILGHIIGIDTAEDEELINDEDI